MVAGSVVKSFASPFTPRSLAFDGKYLWLSGHGAIITLIYCLDRDGNAIKNFATPGSSPRGLTFDGKYLWHCDDNTNMIYCLDRDGNVMKSFSTPTNYPYGLTFDGKYLWWSDYNADGLYCIDRRNGKVIKYFTGLTDTGIGDLAFDGKNLWLTNNGVVGATIYCYDRNDNEIKSFNSPGITPSGLTFDGKYLWHSDSTTGLIYCLTRT